MSYKIFRNGENGHKNSQNVETYDGNFMGILEQIVPTDILCQLRILKQDLFFSPEDLYIL